MVGRPIAYALGWLIGQSDIPLVGLRECRLVAVAWGILFITEKLIFTSLQAVATGKLQIEMVCLLVDLLANAHIADVPTV